MCLHDAMRKQSGFKEITFLQTALYTFATSAFCGFAQIQYSQTCEKRPPKGKTEYGLCRQVVFNWRSLCLT